MRVEVALAGILATVCLCPHAFAGQQHMVVMKMIAHQDGDARLDYASIDGVSRRLYVAQPSISQAVADPPPRYPPRHPILLRTRLTPFPNGCR